MKNYRAVIIDARKIIKYIGMIALIAVPVILASNMYTAPEQSISVTGRKILAESIPVFGQTQQKTVNGEKKNDGLLHRIRTFLFAFDTNNLTTVIASEIPFVDVTAQGYLSGIAKNSTVEVYNPDGADVGKGEPEPQMPGEGQYPIKAIEPGKDNGSGKKIMIRNETEYSIDIDGMLKGSLNFDISGTAPEVLILHTHATECYTDEGVTSYSPDKGDRTTDTDKNVVAVGERIKTVLEQSGIKVIHDTTLHDHPNFNGSYANSLKTAERYLAEYPTIKIVLDIHRDAYIYDDGSKAKFITTIDGKKAAQLMFVVGTNAGGLEHPGWRENMKLALKLQQHISKSYPNLMRGVNLRKERFNGHTTSGSLIIEVGSSGNTLKEALCGAEIAAERIADFLIK